ncbi:hypothetical protein EMIHUDRAFT_437185 [Emiliania huxleyi CCMP1516]|uniref:Uncharacterized protein n=3 Tax=Emiliania huxleyi TaxID=2903 RepID=A0A0D3IPG3_EMIH1|nr:hypothetical protein EMIHUDRAFT_446289 [Emiliania huxleyi CCMP1516]XP_005765577.1 hypothetical protein EMIHUDRAFT_437185 [Emiliania huxleyi CCMP1516]EOD09128.1 hypothetical protein EMIHUDRAFT_446289 [Emiliania huxleyi CCMP1516]EOD13148.1 hypothetical protein EMIHUDRAFT_437185 [Emiliania huxleyi CCMP1516]|eukprot:XP_005761557.1 hypothetical protein EMIHUDRAFT_446289 [Emiliania huxleyi CCMP1516]
MWPTLLFAAPCLGSPMDGFLRPVFGSACLPLDVRSFLTSDIREAVTQQCASLVEGRGTRVCSAECRDAVLAFRGHRCYSHLSQSQRLQPRTAAPLHPRAANSKTLAALQGIWYGLYPASGIDLVEARLDAAAGTLSATKLTGNEFVRAGRVSWEVGPGGGCKMVSSMWQNAYTPRWDGCAVEVADADHMSITLHTGDEGEQKLAFVRAVLPELLRWDNPSSPSHGFHRAMAICGVDPEDASTSAVEALLEVLHHTQGTVLLDQLLLLAPLLLLGSWQAGGGHGSATLLLGGAVLLVLFVRLTYLGVLQ